MGGSSKLFLDQRMKKEQFERAHKVTLRHFNNDDYLLACKSSCTDLIKMVVKFHSGGHRIDLDFENELGKLLFISYPTYIGERNSSLVLEVCQMPLKFMKDALKKYTQDDNFNIKKKYRIYLEGEIIKKQK